MVVIKSSSIDVPIGLTGLNGGEALYDMTLCHKKAISACQYGLVDLANDVSGTVTWGVTQWVSSVDGYYLDTPTHEAGMTWKCTDEGISTSFGRCLKIDDV